MHLGSQSRTLSTAEIALAYSRPIQNGRLYLNFGLLKGIDAFGATRSDDLLLGDFNVLGIILKFDASVTKHFSLRGRKFQYSSAPFRDSLVKTISPDHRGFP